MLSLLLDLNICADGRDLRVQPIKHHTIARIINTGKFTHGVMISSKTDGDLSRLVHPGRAFVHNLSCVSQLVETNEYVIANLDTEVFFSLKEGCHGESIRNLREKIVGLNDGRRPKSQLMNHAAFLGSGEHRANTPKEPCH